MSSGNDFKTLESIISAVDNGIMVLDENLNIHFWNRWLEKQTCFVADQVIGRSLDGVAPYIKIKPLQRKIKSSLKLDSPTYIHSSTSNYLIKIPLKKGVSKIYEYMQQDITIIPLDHDKHRVLLIIYDRTVIAEARSRLENNLRDMRVLNQDLERYMAVIDANVNALKVDATGVINYISNSLCHLTGYANNELLHTDINSFFINGEGDGFMDMMAAVKSAKAWSGELSNLHKDGNRYWVDSTLTPTFTEEGQLFALNFLFHDITDKKLIEKLSIVDSLTGAYNRNKFEDSLTQLINSTQRYNSPLSLILLDIDHFKKVNDNYGHLCGDRVLQELAKLIQAKIRKTDIFARWGGEEFAILLSHTKLEQASQLADKLCKTIAQNTFACIDTVTASFGVAQFNTTSGKQEFLSSCDKALYKSKHNGRNQVTLAADCADASDIE